MLNHDQSAIPGGISYTWGSYQKPQESSNLEAAHTALDLFPGNRLGWRPIVISNFPLGSVIVLKKFFKMHARWKLKDGREFYANEIDLGNHASNFLQKQSLRTQWQRENRKEMLGDGEPILAHDILDDKIRIKWVIRIDPTAIEKRLSNAGGTPAVKMQYEEHIIVEIKGTPTSGLIFSK